MTQPQTAMAAVMPKSEFPRASPIPTNTTAGTKRKRGPTEQKFYAVAKGKRPGVYYTWEECLDQVRGQKGALFKSFPSLHEAQAFADGKPLEPSAKSRATGEQKYYAVQNGRLPGVYTDWPAAQEQITGFRNPRHKKFGSRQEAEAFVKAGQKNNKANGYSEAAYPTTLEGQLQKAMYERSAPGMVLNGTYTPRDKEGNPMPPGRGPFPPGSEDNFDPNIKLEPDGTVRHKTEEEKRKIKTITVAKEGPSAMLKIYTDGSSLSNGQAGARAGVGVFFGPGDAKNVSEALKGSRQTNQRAELTAISRALDIAPRHRQVTIYTDSKYAIDCVTNWYVKWKANGWLNAKGKPVENQDLIKGVREYIEEREMLGVGTWFVWVKGHASDEGNIAADRLAVDGAHLGRGIESDIEREEMEEMTEMDDSPRNGSVTSPAGENEDQEAEEAFEIMKRHMEDGDDEDEDGFK